MDNIVILGLIIGAAIFGSALTIVYVIKKIKGDR